MPRKHSDAKPAEKLLTLYTLLIFNGGRAFSLSDLAGRLDCSKQTILRLVDQIEAAEFGKITRDKRGREVVYSIERPQCLPQIQLNAEGLYQLALCRNLMLHLLPRGLRTQTDKTLREAGAYTKGDLAPDAVVLGQAYTKGRIDYTPHQDMLAALTHAIHEKKVCIVTYKTRLDRPERTFEFAPKRLIAYHEAMIVQGWEVTEKGLAEALYDNPMPLYLHRCKSVTLTRRSTAHLDEPIPAQNEKGEGLFGVMQGEAFTVAAHFAPEAATYVAERIWSSSQTTEIHENGSVTLRFAAQSEPEVISWLLGFGECATVLEPDWLREELGRQGAVLAEMYPVVSD